MASPTTSAMDDEFGLKSNTNLALIEFDEQQKVRIGVALQALADQMVPSAERQLLSNSDDDYNDESRIAIISRNKGEAALETVLSHQQHFIQSELETSNYLSTNFTLSKEEPKLQMFEIKSPEPDGETSGFSKDASYSNEINTINMDYISDEGSDISMDCNEKDSQNNIYSIESDSQDDESEFVIDYKSILHYLCPECGVDCGRLPNWKLHTEKQHKIDWLNFNSVTNVEGESFYQCLDCNKNLKTKTRLQEHRMKHFPHRYYLKCGICDKRFDVLTNVYLHIKQTHSELARPHLKKKYSNPRRKYIKIFCPICLQSQSNTKRWEQHLTEEHDYANKIKSQVTQLGKNIYSCQLCQQKIRKTFKLKAHMVLHEPNKSFQCILCKEYHINLKNALQHVGRKHLCDNQDKLLKCSCCEATFPKKSLLCNHNKNFHESEISKYTVVKNLSASEDDVASGVSHSLYQPNYNHLQPETTNNLSTNINLTKEESQLQKYEVEPPAAGDETLSAHSMDLFYSTEIETLNMQYISDKGSVLSKSFCGNEKDNEDFLDSLESEFQNIQNGEPESVIEYKSFVHYICPECGVDCGPYSKWKIHTVKQHKIAWPVLNPVVNMPGESCYQCLYCNKKFNHKMRFRLVQEHYMRHMPHKYYLKCGFCDKRFQALSNVYPHIKQKHEKLANPYLEKKYSNPEMKYIKIFCPICQQSQSNIKRWHKHLTKKHDYENKIKSQVTQSDKNMYSCQFCQQNICQDFIKIHMLLHEPNKSFQCTLCKKYVAHLSTAVRHISNEHSHNHQNKLLECSYCKATFAKKSSLWNHNQNLHKNEMSNYTDIKYSLSSNEDEVEVDCGISSTLNSNQVQLRTNELLTYDILTKEEPQVQEFKFEYPATDEETLSACSKDLSNSNEKESANTQYISDGGSEPLNDCWRINEKDGDNIIDTIESDSRERNANNEQKTASVVYNKFISYICPVCGVSCGLQSKWKSHIIEKHHKFNTVSCLYYNPPTIVDGKSYYQCRYCNKKLNYKTTFRRLQEHHIKHLPHKYYIKCGFCDKGFQALTSVYAHIRNIHPNFLRSDSKV